MHEQAPHRPVRRGSRVRRRHVLAALVATVVLFGTGCAAATDGAPTPPGAGSSVPTPDTGAAPDPGGTSPGTALEEPLTELESAYVAAVVRAPRPGQPMDREQTACMAPHWVRLIGADRVAAAAVTPEDVRSGDGHLLEAGVDLETASRLVDVLVDCGVDLVDAFVWETTSTAVEPVDPACIEGLVDATYARTFFVTLWSGNDVGSAVERIAPCAVPPADEAPPTTEG